MRKSIIFFFVVVTIFTSGFSQKSFDFRFWEDSLIRLRQEVLTAPSESKRLALNEDFMTLLESVIEEPNSFKFKWDSVKNFSIVTSPDNLIRIFTWDIFKDNRNIENFGFVQINDGGKQYNSSRKKYSIFPLYDKRHLIDYPESFIGNHSMWYGAIYYKIIPITNNNKTYYTLLGFNGNNLFTNQKLIEVLHLKNEKPVFGAKIFKNFPSGKASRIILEYNKEATLSLKYERQSYDKGTGKRDIKTKRVIFESVEADMIIFDQLIPMDESMPNIPAFMVPESSLNQGFVSEDGKWLFVPKVNGRNPDVEQKPHQIKQRDFYRPPN